MQRCGDPHPGRHVEHNARGMKRGMQGREPIAFGVDHGEPVRPEKLRVGREETVGGAEDNALCGKSRVEFVTDNMPVDRRKPTAEGRRPDGLGGHLEVGIRVVGKVTGQNGRGEQSFRRRITLSRRGAGAPCLRLEEPQVGPHPVFVSAIGQCKRPEPLERLPTGVDRPFRQRRRTDKPIERVTVERGSRRNDGGGAHDRRVSPRTLPFAVE